MILKSVKFDYFCAALQQKSFNFAVAVEVLKNKMPKWRNW